MASGPGRLTFLDTAALRSLYPGTFPTEFMFRSPGNLFSSVQFIPERVLEFSISPDGIRFYKVQWQETWLPEHHLLPYQNLIEIFWRSQNELAATTCENNEQSTSSTPTSDIVKPITKEDVSERFLTTLQTSPEIETQMSNENIEDVSVAIEKPLEEQVAQSNAMVNPGVNPGMKHTELKLQDLVKSQELEKDLVVKHQELVKPSDFAKQVENFSKAQDFVKQHDMKEHEFAKQLEFIKQPSEDSFEIIVQRSNDQTNAANQLENDVNQITIEYENVILNLPNNQMLDAALDEGGNHLGVNQLMHMPGDNELTKVMSPRFKKNKQMSIQLEGFELANIENPTATEDELRHQAREVLSSFRRKRVRFPNGSSKLPQTCFFCTKVLSNRKKLREHQFSVHFKNVGEFLCGICQQRFIFRRQLKAHMITHSDNRNYVCKLCGLTCKRRSHLHKHMDTHQKERNYRCDVCHKNFKVQAELKDHCLNEHKSQVSKCNVCKQTLHTAYSVYIHSMRHSGTRDHICQICGASFKRKQHLIAHKKVHENLQENIKCPACEKEFPEKKYFRRHLEQCHKELAPTYRYDYICTICDKDFAYKGRLDEHMKIHAEETEEERFARARKKKVDSMTDDAISKLSDKIEKITNPKTGEVKLKCKLCRRREFRLISTMEKHLEDHKAGFKFMMKPVGNFECDICNKTFHSEARLLRHGIVHQAPISKPNQFHCRRCKKSFKWKSCLQAHTKKCAPISKGAGKRKATLKAKEKLRRQIEDIEGVSSEDDDDIRITHMDDDISPGESEEYDGEELKLAGDQLGTLEMLKKEDVHSMEDEEDIAAEDIAEPDCSSSVSVQGISPAGETSTSSENVIVMRNMDTKQNIISLTHNDGKNEESTTTDKIQGENIYVITVRPTDIMEESEEVKTASHYSTPTTHEPYDVLRGLHSVESNVSVETMVHQGACQDSVEIETDVQ